MKTITSEPKNYSIVYRLSLVLVFVFSISFAQKNDTFLLKVDDETIMTSEFMRVYNKNLDLVKDDSQKDIDGYLKLFTEYQLKLKEAKHLELDKDPKYLREFSRYKKQLTNNYLSENKVTDALVKEAYQRSNEVVKAAHILVRFDEASNDTLTAYNKVLALRKRMLSEDFETLRKNVHNGKTVFVEDLGYFSAFKMVYPFENAAYNTAVGEISMPFKTQFGYHVVKVFERKASQGTINAAHIMIGLKQKDSLLDPEARIKDIYQKLTQGENFEALAKQFSDDKNSAIDGGKIKPFKRGELGSVIFENVAFELEKDSAISKPFKTNFGWHIVKRISITPNPDFETVKSNLEQKVKRDSRSKLINTAMVNQLKERYTISYNPDAISYFETLINDAFFKSKWELTIEDNKKDVQLFTINNTKYTYNAFNNHLKSAQGNYLGKNTTVQNVIKNEFDNFFEKSILKYREENLENENQEYADILKEYRDGLLLFELLDKEIWKKAAQDTLGLENYYNANASKYKWQERVDIVMASSADKSIIKAAKKLIKKGETENELRKKYNTKTSQNIIFTKGIYSKDDITLPENLKIKKGVSEIYKHNESYHVIDIKAILPTGIKTLKEARGSVLTDYQTEVEKNWIEGLYKKYKIEVNNVALERIKASIKK